MLDRFITNARRENNILYDLNAPTGEFLAPSNNIPRVSRDIVRYMFDEKEIITLLAHIV